MDQRSCQLMEQCTLSLIMALKRFDVWQCFVNLLPPLGLTAHGQGGKGDFFMHFPNSQKWNY